MARKLLLFALTLLLMQRTFAQMASGQPTTGPGGSNYKHNAVTFTKFGSTISDCYWLYEPASPKPDSAVVIVFWHGTSSSNDIDNIPSGQQIFCEHLCKKGYTVIYPLYQYGGQTLPFNQQITNGGNVLLMALNNLDSGINRVRPSRNLAGKILIGGTGISRGGGMTMNVAARHLSFGLPSFDALCAFVPGAGQPMTGIDISTKVLVVNGSDNTLNYPESQEAFDSLYHIPCANKHLIVVNSDNYGLPNLEAEHNFAGSGNDWTDSTKVNALDFNGCWKLSVGLFDCAFYNQNCSYCLGSDTLITYMGTWSDGTPITPATIADSCNLTLGIEDLELDNKEIEWYPNPFTSNIKHRGTTGIATYNMTNSFGQMVWSGNEIEQQDFSKLSSGIYFLTIIKYNNRQTVKLMKE